MADKSLYEKVSKPVHAEVGTYEEGPEWSGPERTEPFSIGAAKKDLYEYLDDHQFSMAGSFSGTLGEMVDGLRVNDTLEIKDRAGEVGYYAGIFDEDAEPGAWETKQDPADTYWNNQLAKNAATLVKQEAVPLPERKYRITGWRRDENNPEWQKFDSPLEQADKQLKKALSFMLEHPVKLEQPIPISWGRLLDILDRDVAIVIDTRRRYDSLDASAHADDVIRNFLLDKQYRNWNNDDTAEVKDVLQRFGWEVVEDNATIAPYTRRHWFAVRPIDGIDQNSLPAEKPAKEWSEGNWQEKAWEKTGFGDFWPHYWRLSPQGHQKWWVEHSNAVMAFAAGRPLMLDGWYWHGQNAVSGKPEIAFHGPWESWQQAAQACEAAMLGGKATITNPDFAAMDKAYRENQKTKPGLVYTFVARGKFATYGEANALEIDWDNADLDTMGLSYFFKHLINRPGSRDEFKGCKVKLTFEVEK